MSGLPCPTCGGELAFLDQYQRHYCYSCSLYAPEGFGDRGAQRCPTCTGILSYIRAYERFYCYRCADYPPEGAVMETPPGTSRAPVEPSTMAGETTLVVLEPKAAERSVQPTEPDASVSMKERAREEEETAPEETGPEVAKRPLVREEVEQAKKPLLIDLCNSYDLDPTGTKEALRERLLSYLDDLERESRTAEVEEVAEQAPDTAMEDGEEAMEATGPETVLQDTPPGVGPEQPLPASGPTTTPWLFEAPTRQEEAGSPEGSDVIDTPAQGLPAAESPGMKISRVEHPCPNCRRELTYISQYDRWYCYSCRAYAPRRKAKFACPSCGATLRWISQYGRWWCDSCRRYASSDLPRPERALSAAVTGIASRAAASVSSVHRHRSPGSGIGLVGFGLFLFVIYEVFIDLPIVLGMDTGIVVSPDVAFALRFFAFLFVAAGAIIGLSAVRDQR